MAQSSDALLLAATLVTGVATAVLAVVSWMALAATRAQTEDVVRREHLQKLQAGVLAKFELEFGGFFCPAFDGRNLGFGDGAPGCEGSGPRGFSFKHELRAELTRHFAPLWRAVGVLGEEYAAFAAELRPRVRRLAESAVDCDPVFRGWVDPLEGYLFRRSLRTDDSPVDLCAPPTGTEQDKSVLLNATRRGPERDEIRAWGWKRIEAMRGRYDACREQFARARESVSLQGDCDMVSRRRTW